MVVAKDHRGIFRFKGIQDCRDDPDGMFFGDDFYCLDAIAKANSVDDELSKKATRIESLGYFIQEPRDKK